MSPAEVELLSGDLLADLHRPQDPDSLLIYERFASLVVAFIREWRALWSLHADGLGGWTYYSRLRDDVSAEILKLPEVLRLNSNGASAREVLNARVLIYSFNPPQRKSVIDIDRTERSDWKPVAAPIKSPARQNSVVSLHRPLFIIAAPRSGSTLLFETLAKAPNIYTLGGEGHEWIEGLQQLRPFQSGQDSNRLLREHAVPEVRQLMLESLSTQLRDRDGRLLPESATIRMLEKTPKNALRIPFLSALFPDARFVFLWRDPQENIGSIIDAWRSGGWITYPQLPGWPGPWSLLLPPGWQTLKDAPLEQVATYQWRITNEVAIDDLSRIDGERWIAVRYSDLVANPRAAISRIMQFAELESDDVLGAALEQPLPLSRHTLTPPARDKWKVHEVALQPLLGEVAALERRLLQLE